jgi:hypothetical protein
MRDIVRSAGQDKQFVDEEGRRLESGKCTRKKKEEERDDFLIFFPGQRERHDGESRRSA